MAARLLQVVVSLSWLFFHGDAHRRTGSIENQDCRPAVLSLHDVLSMAQTGGYHVLLTAITFLRLPRYTYQRNLDS